MLFTRICLALPALSSAPQILMYPSQTFADAFIYVKRCVDHFLLRINEMCLILLWRTVI